MHSEIELLKDRKCFSVLLKTGLLVDIYAQECLLIDKYNNYIFRSFGLNVCIMPVEIVENIVEG